jgi:hypothetical protein
MMPHNVMPVPWTSGGTKADNCKFEPFRLNLNSTTLLEES